MEINRKEIEKLFNLSKAQCKVSCDEYHLHSALEGCLSGPEAHVTICKLYEYITKISNKIEEIYKVIEHGKM